MLERIMLEEAQAAVRSRLLSVLGTSPAWLSSQQRKLMQAHRTYVLPELRRISAFEPSLSQLYACMMVVELGTLQALWSTGVVLRSAIARRGPS